MDINEARKIQELRRVMKREQLRNGMTAHESDGLSRMVAGIDKSGGQIPCWCPLLPARYRKYRFVRDMY